jgi:predicted transcriptional regulator
MAQRKDNKQIGSFRMDKDLKRQVEEMAKRENRSFNNMLEVICRAAVENQQ